MYRMTATALQTMHTSHRQVLQHVTLITPRIPTGKCSTRYRLARVRINVRKPDNLDLTIDHGTDNEIASQSSLLYSQRLAMVVFNGRCDPVCHDSDYNFRSNKMIRTVFTNLKNRTI